MLWNFDICKQVENSSMAIDFFWQRSVSKKCELSEQIMEFRCLRKNENATWLLTFFGRIPSPNNNNHLNIVWIFDFYEKVENENSMAIIF